MAASLLANASDFEVGYLQYSYTNTSHTRVCVEGLSTAGQNVSILNIPGYVTYNGTTYKVDFIESTAFYQERNLQHVAIDYGVEAIYYGAFMSCTNLKTIKFPGTLTSIQSKAFYNTGIDDLYFCTLTPPTIASDAFSGLSSGEWRFWVPTATALTAIKSVSALQSPVHHFGINTATACDTQINGIYVVATKAATPTSTSGEFTVVGAKSESLSDLTIKANGLSKGGGYSYAIRHIADSAFVGNNNINTLTVGPSIYTIGYAAFRNCRNMTSASIAAQTIRPYAFNACHGMTSLELKAGVTTLDDYSFYWLTSLETVSIPSTLTGWDESFYKNPKMRKFTGNNDRSKKFFVDEDGRLCRNINGKLWLVENPPYLTKPELPSYITGIRNFAYYNYTGTKVILPFGVTEIGESPFYFASNLTYVFIPSSVTSIGRRPFYQCPNLVHLALNCKTPPTFSSVYDFFFNINSSLKVYVPAQFYSDYVASSSWQLLTDGLGGDCLQIGAVDCSYDYNGKTSYYRLDASTYDAYSAFADDDVRGWSTISDATGEVEVPDMIVVNGETYTVNGVDKCAYQDTEDLELTLPNSIESIGKKAFYNASLTAELDLFDCDNLETISDSAFYNCDHRNIILPPHEVTFGNDAWSTERGWTYHIYAPVDLVSTYYNRAASFSSNGSRFDKYVAGYLTPTEEGKARTFAYPWNFDYNGIYYILDQYIKVYSVSALQKTSGIATTERLTNVGPNNTHNGGNGYLYTLDGTGLKYVRLANRDKVGSSTSNLLLSYSALNDRTETFYSDQLYMTFDEDTQRFTALPSTSNWPFTTNTAYIRCSSDFYLPDGYGVNIFKTLGDMDGNGLLEVNDVVILAELAMSGGATAEQISIGDMDSSGAIDVNDVVILAELVMGS